MKKFAKYIKNNICIPTNGKVPIYKWKNIKNTDLKTINNGDGVGLLTGEINGITIIDLDKLNDKKKKNNLKDGMAKYKKLLVKYNNGVDLQTPTVKTKNGGIHLYFKYDKDIEQTTNINQYSIDTRSNGGYVIIPPSKGYKWKYHTDKYKKLEVPNWLKVWILKNKNRANNKKNDETGDNTKNKIVKGKKYSDKRLSKYLDCLNINRFTNYSDWIRIGFILYNEGASCQLWDKYSSLAPNYNNSCFKKWETFQNNDKLKANITTLIKMCIKDNFKKYIEAKIMDTKSIIKDIFKNGANDTNISYLFYSYEPDTYIFDDENVELYKINKYGIFEKDSKERRGLRKHIYDLLIIKLNEEFNIRYNEKDVNQINILKNYTQIRKYLEKYKNKKYIADELCTLYTKKRLFEKLDNINDNLLAFDNGVFDFETFKFRKAKPSEYITCTTKYKYKKRNKENIKYINSIINSIFSIKEEREYVLKTLSSCIIGDNTLEEFYLWIGTGGNGKGILRDLMFYTLGEYFDSMDIEYICKNKHNSNAKGADPIMARKKNCRLIITTEPEGSARLKSSKLKELSGRDIIQVRDLYKSTFNFVPKFKIIIQTNQEIEIDGSDGGIIRRFRYITFRNKFVDNPKLPCHKKIDRTLKTKLKQEKYRLAFFHILIYYYEQIKGRNGIDMPPTFKKETEIYLNESDPLQLYLDECVEITNNNKDYISSSKLYQSFFDYYNGNTKGIIPKNFKSKLINKGYIFKRISKGRGFCGIKFIEEDDILL